MPDTQLALATTTPWYCFDKTSAAPHIREVDTLVKCSSASPVESLSPVAPHSRHRSGVLEYAVGMLAVAALYGCCRRSA